MWRRGVVVSPKWKKTRQFCTAAAFGRTKDEGDWSYSSEWWGANYEAEGHSVLRCISDQGNGVVSIHAYPSSIPSNIHWPKTEKWLHQRYADFIHDQQSDARFKVLGYQWRTLRFNDVTRQSTVKVMAAYKHSEPNSIFLMQQAHCVAVPYVKSMISVGLATIASSTFDLTGAVYRKKPMHILCIGHGGGTLPLFLASKIQGSIVHVVEIDPLVISASVGAMGFPAFSVMASESQRALPHPNIIDEVMWRGIHERLFLYESDAEKFVLNTSNIYDMVFIDAYDGDDIFPRKLWDVDSPFLKALESKLHPEHGTVVVNLHADDEADPSVSYFYDRLPMSKHVPKVCQAYKDVLVRKGNHPSGSCGAVFTVSVPWVCNTSMVACRGIGTNNRESSSDAIVNAIISKGVGVDKILNLPFSCLDYMKKDITFVD
ncbi:S-adenosyl-L-methionine-dependent methyltransferases superfamily protein [Euphorbia peplus]|nr:S-adenosyl-L-methionine-dependent methyltransferases superfamily protein [Euphorbia peplus]